MIQVQLKNQTGRIDAPYVNLLTIETFALPASVVDGTTVALLTPEGDTLAIGHASGGQVTLDSNTLQAAGYCHGVAVGESRNAFLVIGETDLLLAIIPVLVRANPLDDLAPPAQMAPAYPTTAELHEILAKVQASAKAATEAATTAATETVEAVRVEMKAEIDRFEDVADAIDSDRRIIADYVDNKLPAAANKIAQDIDASATAAKNALTATATSATQTIAGQVSTATSAAENADGSAKAAYKSRQEAEAAKTAAEIALNNGCIYEVRDVADATIGLDKTLTAYKHAPTGDTSYTFNSPQGAEGKIVVFWLWVIMGETAHALTFPASVTWLSEPSFAPNTQTLLALMSVDGGATWTANVQWDA